MKITRLMRGLALKINACFTRESAGHSAIICGALLLKMPFMSTSPVSITWRCVRTPPRLWLMTTMSRV